MGLILFCECNCESDLECVLLKKYLKTTTYVDIFHVFLTNFVYTRPVDQNYRNLP